MRTTETMLHNTEIELLDRLKIRLGLSSRSDAVRLVLAKADLDKVKDLEPWNLEAEQEMLRLKKTIQKNKEEEKKVFGQVFANP